MRSLRIRRFGKELLLPKNSTIVIHIGKCGGSSLTTALSQSEKYKDFHTIHIEKPPIRRDLRYYILARNPISRALSAFNWRYKLVVEDQSQKTRFAGEYDVLQKYSSLNALALALYEETGAANPATQSDLRRIHHLKEDLAFYLKEVLDQVHPTQILGILMQETLNADMKRVFGLKHERVHKSNRTRIDPEKLHLDAQAHANLERFFATDFACLRKLHRWDKLSEETWAELS